MPQKAWQRDRSLPYSSADDYAIVTRFYIQLLRNRIGRDFADRNVEAILKVNTVDGKTGAPSILAVQVS